MSGLLGHEADLPRFKVATEQGVYVGDTATQPIRKAAAAAPAEAPPSPRFVGAPGVATWLDSRWWQWVPNAATGGGGHWAPVARAATAMRWGDSLPLSPELGAYVRGQLEASLAEPLAMRLSDGGVYLLAAERGRPVLRPAIGTLAALGELPPPPAGEVLEPWRDAAESMRKCAEQIASDFRRRRVVEDAHRVVSEARAAGVDVGPRGRPNRRAIVWALFRDQKKRADFHDDPHNTELVGSTEAILCLDPDGVCLRGGDCDDQIVALGSRVMAMGIVVRLRARRYRGKRLLHVVLEFDSSRNGKSVWEAIDPSTESGKASEAPYEQELFQAIDTAPMFVGLGEPPDDDEEGAAMLGQALTGGTTTGEGTSPGSSTTASTTQMDPSVAAAWVGLLQNVKTAFDASLQEMTTVAADYAAFRTTLGLAPTDDAAGGVGTTSTSSSSSSSSSSSTSTTPLTDYMTSVASGAPVWTTAAQTAETNLIAAGAFISQALADGLSGARVLTYDTAGTISGGNPDLFVGALAGDTYSILFVKDAATGALTPEYFTPQTTTATGTLGSPWDFVVGAAALAAVTLAVAWAVTHYMDKERAAHNDDMLQKVTQQQDQLIAAGQMTPQQGVQQIQALGQAGAAMNPPSTTANSLATVAQWIGIASLGVASIFVTRAILAALPSKSSRLGAARSAHDSSSSYRGADTRRERDELAEQNIPEELVPLWRRERSRFRGTPHERSEAFLEWAETDEGQGAVFELLQERSDTFVEQRCTCNDETGPRCCGPGCCSWHRGIQGGRRRRRRR